MGEPMQTDIEGRFVLDDVPDEPGVFLRVAGSDVLTQSFAIDGESMGLDVVRRVRLRVRSVTTEGVVAFGARDATGTDLAMQAFEGRRLVTQKRVQLVAGRSAWIALPDTAIELLGLDREGAGRDSPVDHSGFRHCARIGPLSCGPLRVDCPNSRVLACGGVIPRPDRPAIPQGTDPKDRG